MPLIVEINHPDYATSNVAKSASDVNRFLQKEKRFSLDESRRKISKDFVIDLINEYGCAKLYLLKDGSCIGGIYPAEYLQEINEMQKEKERESRFII